MELAFTPDGKRLVTGGVWPAVWDVASGERLTTLKPIHGFVQSIAFSVDGDRVVMTDAAGCLQTWDLRSKKEVAPPVQFPPQHLSWAKYVAGGKAMAGHLTVPFPENQTADANNLAANGDALRICDCDTGRVLASFVAKSLGYPLLSSSGTMLAVQLQKGTGHSIVLWDWKHGRKWSLAGIDHSMNWAPLAFCTQDTVLLLLETNKRLVSFRKISTGQELLRLSSRPSNVAVSSCGRLIATGERDHTIKLWDYPSGKLRRTLRGHVCRIDCLAFSPDGRRLASASGSTDRLPNQVMIWDVATGRLHRRLRERMRVPLSLAFRPDGKTLIAWAPDVLKPWAPAQLQTWNLATRRPSVIRSGRTPWVGALAFTPDGDTLIESSQYPEGCSTDDVVNVIDGRTGACRTHWTMERGDEARFAVTPDGMTLARTVLGNKRVTLYDTRTGRIRRVLHWQDNKPRCLGFSPDGTVLAIGGEVEGGYHGSSESLGDSYWQASLHDQSL